jgi:hypothetical protein
MQVTLEGAKAYNMLVQARIEERREYYDLMFHRHRVENLEAAIGRARITSPVGTPDADTVALIRQLEMARKTAEHAKREWASARRVLKALEG